MTTALSAFGYGALAASALVLGAIVGLVAKPKKNIVALVMAFGSGTLLSAVAFDLCEEAFEKSGAVTLIIGFLLGGGIFLFFNHLMDEKGGFLRKNANKQRFLIRRKRELASSILQKLSHVDIVRSLPPEEVQAIVPFVERQHYSEGHKIFSQGETGDALYIINSGKVNIRKYFSDGGGRDVEIATLSDGETFGEMALLTNEARSATAIALSTLEVYRIKREDFDRLIAHSPKLALAAKELLARRLDHTSTKQAATEKEAQKWQTEAMKNVEKKVTAEEEKTLIEQHTKSGAPLAIFIGAVIDGVPESIVIGAGLIATGSPSFSFLAAVFLSNFPEAMSSAAGMTQSGFSSKKILGMWSGLLILAGLSALLGNIFLAGASPFIFALAESLAAGGILAMVANTMMPEAFELGGPPVAISTIMGFLTAFLMSAMGQH